LIDISYYEKEKISVNINKFRNHILFIIFLLQNQNIKNIKFPQTFSLNQQQFQDLILPKYLKCNKMYCHNFVSERNFYYEEVLNILIFLFDFDNFVVAGKDY